MQYFQSAFWFSKVTIFYVPFWRQSIQFFKVFALSKQQTLMIQILGYATGLFLDCFRHLRCSLDSSVTSYHTGVFYDLPSSSFWWLLKLKDQEHFIKQYLDLSWKNTRKKFRSLSSRSKKKLETHWMKLKLRLLKKLKRWLQMKTWRS